MKYCEITVKSFGKSTRGVCQETVAVLVPTAEMLKLVGGGGGTVAIKN